MPTKTLTLALALTMAIAWGGSASAQTGSRPVELNAHAGALFWDDKVFHDIDPQLIVGGRLVLHRPGGLGFGGNVDYSSTTIASQDVTTWFLSGEVDYTFASSGRARFFVGAGIGGAFRRIEGDLINASGDFFLLPIGGGIKLFSSTDDPRWLLRVDARDNIIWADDEATEEDDKGARNNFELSAGLSVLLGGGQ